MPTPCDDAADPVQLPRFGPLRGTPPPGTLAALTGAEPGTGWTVERLGDDHGYPNGGMWWVTAGRRRAAGPASAVVKRTGPHHLGTFAAWHLSADPADPAWWGREAEFYLSDLASRGWAEGTRTARCEVDDHDGCRDLWMERAEGFPASLEVCRRAVAGLAHWQVAHLACDRPWLSRGWIASHLGRYRLDNATTLAHASWPTLIDRGVDPAVRDAVAARLTDPAAIDRVLDALPQALTHHDFHNGNIGTVDGRAVVIDWAYVGHGPIGHDVGHLALTLEPPGAVDPVEAWHDLESVYCRALAEAGWRGDPAEVRRSMAVSNRIRLGWSVDALLARADTLGDAEFADASRVASFLAKLE